MKYENKKNIIIASIVVLVGFLAGSLTKPGKEIIKYFEKDATLYLVEEVIDGDTFVISQKVEKEKSQKVDNKDKFERVRVRFYNINAPEKGECYYEESTQALKDLILNKQVKLIKDISDKDDYGRLLRYVVLPNTQMDTDVTTDNADNNDDLLVEQYLAKNGFVKYMPSSPDNRYVKVISSAMWHAYDNQLGMWKACDYKPENISKRQKDTGPPNPDCIIKGNVSSKGFGKTYLIPGCDNYNSVKIDPSVGDKYFCSEEEAENAGFRKANGCP